jgi:8-oxo-dGTP pyrophosphatase MutT (NUDIX family)
LVNPKSPRASDEEVGQWIENFVDKYGESKSCFYYSVGYADEKGTLDFSVKQKEYILQKEKSLRINEGYPFDRYLKDPNTGEFRIEQSFRDGFGLFADFIKNEFLKKFSLETEKKGLDYLEKIKIQQKNWIGRSEGAELEFRIKNNESRIKVFTTRPDTLFGCTYLVLSPEHPLVENLKSEIKNWDETIRYIVESKKITELERVAENKEKTGVELKGIKAINPANGEEIPVWIADYVLADYGTGAIMAVPAHDERDFAFAKKYHLSIKEVIVNVFGEKSKTAVRRDSVAGIIYRSIDKKILLLFNRKTNEYEIPSGGKEDGEDDLATLTREVKEESGYTDFEVGEYLGQIQTNFFALRRNENRFKFQKGFEVFLKSEKVIDLKPDVNEDFERLWVMPEEAIKKLDSNKNISYESEFVKHFVN